ncbi:MAG: hypothetical protein HY238_09480 [Acidobacteria bacterium]|nr:hypothetical protein [Acidobacteriota bacterium]
MRQRIVWMLSGVLLLATGAFGQTQDGYVDVFIAKVKPEKRAEFDAIAKRIAAANRRNKGDNFVASETIYGDWNTLYFTSLRQNQAEVEKAFDAFFGALAKAAGGPAGGAKMFQDMNNCLVSTRAELRRRRNDLSSNVPDPAGLLKLVGQSRWSRTVMLRVRPGRTTDVERELKAIKAARERSSGPPILVSQGAAGQVGTIFYITSLVDSLGRLDDPGPSLPQLLGEEGYQRFSRTISETTLSVETIINRYLPELSNPLEGIAAASPEFWRPKPAPAPAKPRTPTDGGKSQ